MNPRLLDQLISSRVGRSLHFSPHSSPFRPISLMNYIAPNFSRIRMLWMRYVSQFHKDKFKQFAERVLMFQILHLTVINVLRKE